MALLAEAAPAAAAAGLPPMLRPPPGAQALRLGRAERALLAVEYPSLHGALADDASLSCLT